MGAVKEWGIPFALALATFAGLSLVDLPRGSAPDEADAKGGQPPVTGVVTRDGITYPFPFPVVADNNQTPAILLLSQAPQPVAAPWRTPHVALSILPPWPAHGDCWGDNGLETCPGTPRLGPPGSPRLGVEGYNATRVTVHVFDADGELVFSNGDAAEQASLTRRFAPEQLPEGVWYFGAKATAPNGTQRLPGAAHAFLQDVFPLIEGLPEGGVASTETNALRAWYGTLFVTLRVDELLHAP